MKLCRQCHLNEGVFCDSVISYKDKIYRYFSCKECNSKRARNYRKTPSGKSVYENIRRRQYEKYKNKALARAKLNYAVKVGEIIRPIICQSCFKKAKTEGHHGEYDKPLVVEWLCRNCHVVLHQKKCYTYRKNRYIFV